MINIPKNKQLILFDGVCNLCNYSVQNIISLDKNDIFMFAALDSKTGKSVLENFDINITKVDSIILYKKDKIHFKSSAILRIMSSFGLLWEFFMVFWIIPKPIRDFFYDFIARNRYKWFGKTDSCMIPNEKIKNKFLK